ncbi:hypothetical protein RDI58_012521 [Solanum bulbocastanum]|uniref:Uncharacterized protein n=1 Tax=Solanum bulbocastanum TaxID=147425 RepID=A0AAN8TPY5_SOLBU
MKVLTPNSCKKGKLLSDTKGKPDSEMICKWSCTALAEVAIPESLGNFEFIKKPTRLNRFVCNLVIEGDMLVFQLIQPCKFKVRVVLTQGIERLIPNV